MDSHTVASRSSLCKLKNFIDEDCDLPHFIKNRFACGFPKDWELLRRKWIMFLKAGEPQDFQWKGNDNAAILDSCSSSQKPLDNHHKKVVVRNSETKLKRGILHFHLYLPTISSQIRFMDLVLTML
ncbi:uncharacterized protein LOC126212601 [Schistocerca nitens]|uniref:uncharacterized protein LOC126212601 n=1 Tax=Schistocerca nitens TaxID=7011 RepID=UPI00211767C2|nr:uncharacterized protein LOC126212601 [Schistocerca nitens]